MKRLGEGLNFQFNRMRFAFRAHTNLVLQEFFLQLSSNLTRNFLEIGAREATSSISFLQSTKDGRALAFEANPFTFEAITRGALGQGVECFNYGVSDVPSVKTMYIPLWSKNDLSPANSSFLTRSQSISYSEVAVSCVTIDQIFETQIVRGPTALWIDAEGMAYQVLIGAMKVLDAGNVKTIFVEVEKEKYWKNQSLVDAVTKILKSFDYVLCARDFEYGNQYNQVYVKKECLWKSIPILCKYWVQFVLIIPNLALRYIVKKNRMGIKMNNGK